MKPHKPNSFKLRPLLRLKPPVVVSESRNQDFRRISAIFRAKTSNERDLWRIKIEVVRQREEAPRRAEKYRRMEKREKLENEERNEIVTEVTVKLIKLETVESFRFFLSGQLYFSCIEIEN